MIVEGKGIWKEQEGFQFVLMLPCANGQEFNCSIWETLFGVSVGIYLEASGLGC